MGDTPLHGPVQQAVLAAHPAAKFEFDGPTRGGFWWLDITLGGKMVIIEWRPKSGFGVSLHREDAGYGEGHDAVFPDVDGATARILELLRG